MYKSYHASNDSGHMALLNTVEFNEGDLQVAVTAIASQTNSNNSNYYCLFRNVDSMSFTHPPVTKHTLQ